MAARSRHLLVELLAIFMSLLTLWIFSSSLAQALPTDQRKVIDSGALYFNIEDGGSSCQTRSSTSTVRAGRLFMVGDSITDGARKDLEAAYSSQGFSATIDSRSGRFLTVEPDSGQSVLETRTADIQGTTVVVIALGTNGGLSSASIKDAIATVNAAEPDAQIFWVNIGGDNSKRDRAPIDFESTNQTLSAGTGYTVIDWYSVVSQNPDYVNNDGIGVHLTSEGYKAFADTIAKGISGKSDSSGCGRLLPGSNNAEKIWNFFIEKGVEPWIIAGMIGNMQAESCLNHLRMQGSACESAISSRDVAGGNIPSGQGPAWGIVQWDPPSKMINPSFEDGATYDQIDTLEFQLEFLWGQLTGTGIGGAATPGEKARAGDPLFATTNVEDAALSFAQDYERCRDCDSLSHIQPRIDFAVDILNRFGSGT